jgi:hypothetical protein
LSGGNSEVSDLTMSQFQILKAVRLRS